MMSLAKVNRNGGSVEDCKTLDSGWKMQHWN